MRSHTTSPRSSPCRTTTVCCIERRNARCSRFSRSVRVLPHARTFRSKYLIFGSNALAPRCRMHPMESLGERFTDPSMGCDQRAWNDGHVSVQVSTKKPQSLTFRSWSGMYKGNNGSEAIVQRFVPLPHIVPCQAGAYQFPASRS